MLKYKSVHELEQHSGLPEALQRKMLNDRMTLEETLKKVDTLKKAAKKERMHGNVENEYSYLFRICEICILVTQRHPILKRTVTNASPDSRRLRDVWKSTLKDLDEVSIRLNKLYSERTPMNAVQVPQNEVQPQVPTTPEKPPLPSCLIMPMDLVKFVEDKQEPKTALIVDFREQKTLIVKFKKETQITVLDVPRDCIKRPLIFETLIQSVAVGERAPLTKLSSFNKIVLLDSGDEADPVDENGEIRGDSIARLLYAALYEYNMRSLPKSAPVYMKGGFKNWRTTYPMYTASADGSAKMSWGSDEGNISKAIAALRKSRPAAFEMEYPDLMAKPKPTPLPRQPSPVQQVEPKSPAQPIAPTSSSEDLHAPLAKIQVTQPSVYLPSRPASPSVAPSVPTPAAVVPKPEPPRGPPVFDRSAKPKETTFDARVPGEALQANVQVVSSREVPQVPSLPVAPARPSVDRSTKEAVARKEADFQRDLLAVYEVCTQDLRNMSRYARVQPGYTGLVNITNTCFMNSTLQALANTPPLRELFTVRNFARHVNRYSKRGTQGEISAAFTALLDTLWCGEFTALNPQVFRSIFAHSVNRFLANGQQHDAAEFENVLIDALHEDTNSVSCPKQIIYPDFTGENIHADSMKYESISKQFSDSPINSIFNLHTVAPKRCTSCGRQTVNFSAQLCITMDIPLDGETTMEDCLTRSFSAESIEVQCVFCKKTQRMSRHTKLWKLPKVLVIQLKRFGEYGNALRKNEINVRFGNHLSLKPFMHDQADVSKSVYSLYSVTNHVGNLNSGHYYAYVKNPVTKQWLEFNDEAVKPMSEDSLQSRAAFVLYYTNT
ncbi:hypothetical protein L596_008807 [Steinernema carpocapsae]|uniref:ubiquitinyl hydrolase 1 n=1 Tax=Steinernema carpocapsae TaxID=34508 RepID=A0A4U5PEQ1_STECR|nr:hypothetical protein L596_008807 [Steinernema carpocapsae]